jgi:hypothetical protein
LIQITSVERALKHLGMRVQNTSHGGGLKVWNMYGDALVEYNYHINDKIDLANLPIREPKRRKVTRVIIAAGSDNDGSNANDDGSVSDYSSTDESKTLQPATKIRSTYTKATARRSTYTKATARRSTYTKATARRESYSTFRSSYNKRDRTYQPVDDRVYSEYSDNQHVFTNQFGYVKNIYTSALFAIENFDPFAL